MSRVPLLHVLRKAFYLSQIAKKPGAPAIDELIDRQAQHTSFVHRRQFIGDVVKTGVAISAAGLLQACKRVTDIIPTDEPPGQAFSLKSNQPKIVIIGGGMAGLNCAYQLKKSGYTATIYEAATRIGGRIFTKNDLLAPGIYTELGGEFIDSEHKDMLKLCQEFKLTLLDTRTKTESAYARDSFFIDGRFYSEAEVIQAFQPYAKRIAADIQSLPNVMTYDHYDAVTLHFDTMSIKAYLDSIGMSGFLRKGIDTAYLTEYGLENEEQSSINFLYLFSANTSNGFDIFGTSDERYKIQGGNQTLTNILYQQVKDQVRTEHQLLRIKETANSYTLYFSTPGDTTTVHADMIVCTMPFTLLREVQLDVTLPEWKTNAINNLGYGTNSKLLLGFTSRVWRNYQYSGYLFSNQAIQTGWDNSWAQPGTNGGFTVYQGGNKGVALGNGTPESQAPQFVQQLEQMWPGCQGAFNGTAKRMHWPTYPFTKGSYACYKVGQYTTIRGAEIKPVGNLYFAGEHCSSYFQGFMNGAAETGRMAAESVIKNSKKVAPLVESVAS